MLISRMLPCKNRSLSIPSLSLFLLLALNTHISDALAGYRPTARIKPFGMQNQRRWRFYLSPPLNTSSVDPLVVGRVIGDVVDMFIPTLSVSVYFGSKHVTNGCDIKPSIALSPPKVAISGHSDELFTLVMTDPDAPSPSEPSMREWVHWIVVDIPGGTNPNRGKEILPYVGPRPPVGIHRFILVLFRQKAPLGLVDQPPSRANFNTRYFAGNLDLGLPVATVYFNSQKEPASKRR